MWSVIDPPRDASTPFPAAAFCCRHTQKKAQLLGFLGAKYNIAKQKRGQGNDEFSSSPSFAIGAPFSPEKKIIRHEATLRILILFFVVVFQRREGSFILMYMQYI